MRKPSSTTGWQAGAYVRICFRDQVLDACHEFARPAAPGKQGNSLETIRNMVMSGMGISVLPASALTPKYANPLVRAIDFAPRAAAITAVVDAIAKLDLPIEALREELIHRHP